MVAQYAGNDKWEAEIEKRLPYYTHVSGKDRRILLSRNLCQSIDCRMLVRASGMSADSNGEHCR